MQELTALELVTGDPEKCLGQMLEQQKITPGDCLEFEGKAYVVLERRHRYLYRGGRYQLHRIVLAVSPSDRPQDKSWVDQRWVIGDASCRFNAKSPLMRCAIAPTGPCEGCSNYEAY